MAFKVNTTVCANNSAQVPWARVQSVPSTWVTAGSTTDLGVSGTNFIVNITLTSGTLAFTVL